MWRMGGGIGREGKMGEEAYGEKKKEKLRGKKIRRVKLVGGSMWNVPCLLCFCSGHWLDEF